MRACAQLELLPSEVQQTNEHIKFPAQLEQHIMEGSYNRVLSAKQDGTYAQEGMYFMDMLVDTVREEITTCSEKAYASIGAAELQSMLMLGSEAELREYADEVRAPPARLCPPSARPGARAPAADGARACGRGAGACRADR